MSQSNNRTPPALFAIGGEIARSMVKLHMHGASQFVQTQVDFLSAMQSASAPDETRRVQRQYIEAMCNGAQQHAEGLVAVFANLGTSPKPANEATAQPATASTKAATASTKAATASSKPTSAPAQPTQAPAADQPPAAPAPREASAATDDLTQVSGIGRVFATKLAALGITRFTDLANLDIAELDDDSHPLHDYRARVVSDEWVEQAQALAAQSR